MRLSLLPSTLTLIAFSSLVHAKSWSFQDATLSVTGKGSGADASKVKLTPGSPLTSMISLGSTDTLKLLLTAVENKTPKRPNQAYLILQDPSTGLEDSFPLSSKESGKAKVELTFKDLPVQFLKAKEPLKASLVLASFGSSTPIDTHLFDLTISLDQSAPLQLPEKPLRYGKLAEIHHVFRSDPKSPPMIITLVFVAMALMTFPILIGLWASLGVNLNHLSEALSAAPVSHAAFIGSIVALEGVFFLYYKDWKLYQMLPATGVLGLVALISGSRALSEVQGRRLVGKR